LAAVSSAPMSDSINHRPSKSDGSLSDQECERIARPVGSAFRYACLYLDDPERRAVSAVRALDQTLEDIRRQVAEPHVAKAKLDWWNNSLYRLTQADAPPPDTPITQALIQALTNLEIPFDQLVPALENRLGGAELELNYQGFDTETDMSAYLDATGGAVFELYARLLGRPDSETALWRQVGGQHQRLTRLQYLGRDIRSGFIYLPQSLMTRHGVSDADLFRPDAAAALGTMLQSELEQLIEARDEAIRTLMSETRRPHRFIRAIVAMDHGRIRSLERLQGSVLEERPELSAFRRLSLAWWAGKRPLRTYR